MTRPGRPAAAPVLLALLALMLLGAPTSPAAGAGPTHPASARADGDDADGPVAVVAPLPADADPAYPGPHLAAVTCPAPGDCLAAGTYRVPGGLDRPFVDQLADGAWSPRPLPLPKGASAQAEVFVQDLSCAATAFCAVVGDYLNGQRRLPWLATWNGASWTAQVVALPSDGRRWSESARISCGAVGSCVAVADYETRAGQHRPLLLGYDGSTWTATAGPLPEAAPSGELVDVACSTATDCVAVGRFTVTGLDERPLALVRSAAGWTAVAPPVPGRPQATPHSVLSSVSCAGASHCVAVGVMARRQATLGLAETYDDTAWTGASVGGPPGEPGRFRALEHVDCASADRCVATGTHLMGATNTSTAMVAVLGPGRPVAVDVVAPSDPGRPVELDAVTCSSAGPCLAVGTSRDPAGLLAEVVGTSVTTGFAPLAPPSAYSTSLEAVALDSPTTGVAVGQASGSEGSTAVLVTGIPVPAP